MQKLRIAAIAAAITSALCAAGGVLAHHHGLTLERQILVTMAVSSGFSVLPIYCMTYAMRALQRSTAVVCDRVTDETRALHRSMVVTMEQYGDSRAVDAVVAAERRHAVNERGHDTTDLSYLGRVNAGNVTPLRKR